MCERFKRLLRLVQLLQTESLNCRQLADRLNTTPRTVFRDLELLKDIGLAPIAYLQHENRYRWSIPEGSTFERSLCEVLIRLFPDFPEFWTQRD